MQLYPVQFTTASRSRTIVTRASSAAVAESMVAAWLKLQGLKPLTVAAQA